MHQDTNNTSSVWLAPLWPTGASTFQKKIPRPAEFNAVSARMPDLLSAPGVPGSWTLGLAAGQKGRSETRIPPRRNANQALGRLFRIGGALGDLACRISAPP